MNTAEYPEALETLIELFKGLPGVGRRGAERMALAILKWPEEKLEKLALALRELPVAIGRCPECGAWAAAGERCRVCAAPGRDRRVVCVVEEPQQIFTIEKSGQFRGFYHVLGGRLSPLDGENGENLSTGRLLERVGEGEITEVILALSSDVEGRATAVYLADLLKPSGVKITQVASGLPAGANLAYADAATIGAAFSYRREV